MAKYILTLTEVDKDDVAIAGGKGANLGDLTRSGIPVPPGFVVTADAYETFLEKNKLTDKMSKLLSELDPEDTRKLYEVAREIQKFVLAARLPSDITAAIEEAYRKFGAKLHQENPFVAVRSSPTTEDSSKVSFAGQHDTFLNVRGVRPVIENVKRVWASLFEARTLYYRAFHGEKNFDTKMAVVVQRMVQSDKSGALMTIDPASSDTKKIVIEAGWGLGEGIASGTITPDRYVVDKASRTPVGKEISNQPWKIALTEGGDKHVAVPVHMQQLEKLSDREVGELTRIARNIEQYYGKPQDVEWAIEGGDVFILRARPVTTTKMTKNEGEGSVVLKEKAELLLKGIPASVGMASGPVKLLHSVEEIIRVARGDVLVAEMTNPSFVPAMQRAAAIITDAGGQTSHAAIVSREFGLPCVVGTGKATSLLKDGTIVTVDGAAGLVFRGDLKMLRQSERIVSDREFVAPTGGVTEEVPVTGTKLFVNLGEPFLAEKVALLPVDGVGLLRAEFIVASMGEHPHYLVSSGKRERYIDALADGIETIARAFHPRPVIYRTSDFKTNEYRGLKGGEKYEPQEENPMIGYRGAFRYLREPDFFKMELEALWKVRTRFDLKNVWLMIPMVRTVEEFVKIRGMIEAFGLKRSRDFKLWIMCEVPSTVFLIDEFCQLGIDGVSIGSSDLTQLILGLDRDNPHLAGEFDERDPAVMKAMRQIVEACHRHHVTSSICGKAPSVYPEVVEALVEAGITSISVNPDVAVSTRKLIASVEKRVLLRHAIAEQNRHLQI